MCSPLVKRKGGGKLYLYQLRTDQEEKLFSSVRTINHARNCDALELGQRLLHAETINTIISKHVTWKRFKRKRVGAYNDATSQDDWSGDLDVTDVDLHQQWIIWIIEACKVLGIKSSYFSSGTMAHSMLQQNKRLVEVTVGVEREEIEDSAETSISDSGVLTTGSTNDGPETGMLTDMEENEISLDIRVY